MITKGYLLIHSDGTAWEPYETILGFSEDKNELEKDADIFNKKREEALIRFQSLSEQINLYKEKFDDFRNKFIYRPSKEEFQEWLRDNPIPNQLTEFLNFLEPYEDEEEYQIYLQTTSECDLNDSYYVSFFGTRE